MTRRGWEVPAHLGALAAVVVGDRIGEDVARPALWIAGGLVAAALAARRLRGARHMNDPAERRLEARLGVAMLVGAALVPLSALRVASVARRIGIEAPATRHAIDVGGLALVVGLALLALAPLVLAEVALARQRFAARREVARVVDSARSGAVIASVAIGSALAVWAASQSAWTLDGSSGRATRAGDATRRVLADLPQPVRAVAFFSARSEVGGQVVDYLRDLEGDRLRVERIDPVLDPRAAAALDVEGPGIVALASGVAVEQIALGEDPRGLAVRRLDAEVHRALLRLSRPERVAYLTTGHGEAIGRAAGGGGVRAEKLRALLRAESLEARELSLGDGLGRAVPDDAAMVLILGPERPFAAEELAALARHREGGGRVLVAVEPDRQEVAAPLLEPLGLAASAGQVVLETAMARRRGDASDRAILVVTGDASRGGSIASHPSVASLARAAGRAQLVLAGAAALHHQGPPTGASFVLRSDAASFLDRDGDFERGEGESLGPFELAVAIERPTTGGPPSRALVIGDVDVLSDEALASSESNALFALDVLRWLGGEERRGGALEAPADVRVVHTRKGDALWFWLGILGVPALVVAAGAAIRRRLAPSTRPLAP